MKISALVLSAMSVAVLSSCQDKAQTQTKPKEQPAKTTGADKLTPAPPADSSSYNCPACGMG